MTTTTPLEPTEEPEPVPPPTPRRPTSLAPRDLGFERRHPVAWLSPSLLAATAARVVGAQFFGAYLDKRELQGVLPASIYDHTRGHDGDDFWFDYTADLGDGFDPVYSVAWLLAQPELRIGDESLQRGHMLVLGGDEVYPTPDIAEYENRFCGPYLAARPLRSSPVDDAPSLYALPGNHDWYDGLTAFLRLFGRPRWIGGWRTRQSRSYFALRLPQRWWLYAVDTQLSSYIDEPQLNYFEAAAEQLHAGDRVILCVGKPAWTKTPGSPEAYDTIDYFIRRVIDPTDARCRLVVSGDLHHYSRYERTPKSAVDEAGTAPDQLITCGSGGAYLSDTAHLPETVQAPSPDTTDVDAGPPSDYRLEARFPSKDQSRRYARGIFRRILQRNPGFATLLGIVHVLLLMAFLAADRPLFAWTSIGVGAAVIGGTVALAGRPRGDTGTTPAVHRAFGVAHGAAHLLLAGLGSMVWSRLPFDTLPSVLPGLCALLLYGPIAAFAATELVALYLLIAGRFGVNVNELFAGQAIKDSKGFLRLRIGSDGSLTIYPIGVDRVCRRWQAAPDDPPEAPWISPRTPPEPHLIEPPIRLDT